MRLFYGPCRLVQEQKGVLEPPEPPPGYATGMWQSFHIEEGNRSNIVGGWPP